MKVSFALGAVLISGLLAASSASANVADSKALGRLASAPTPAVLKADFVQGHEAVAGFSAREHAARAEASRDAASRYFDFDVMITLGALAMASGAFVAVGIAGARRRAQAEPVAEAWRTQVMQALEADLMQFSGDMRRAA
jgi:hypothetical protein